jgi:hypothetical protein
MQSNCPPNHPKRQPLFLLLALSLIAAAPAGKEAKTMNSIAVEQLGAVSPRQSVGSWRGNEAVEPMPIVQWQNGEVGMAFVHEWKTNSILGSFKETITPITTGAQGRAGSGSDYPIRFSGRARGSHSEREMAAFDLDHHVAADLTGNGIDELILPRHQGGLDVYGSQGKIASWTAPGRDEKYYANDVVLVHKAKHDNRERVYFVFRSEPYSNTKIPEAVASAHAVNPAEVIAEASMSGVRTVPVQGLPGTLLRIAGLAYFVPASGQPELVICSRLDLDGKEKNYLSRHRLDGSPIEPPREIYVDKGLSYESRMEFVPFRPGDPFLIAVGSDNNVTAFVWPEKEVNWFKPIHPPSSALFKGVVDRASGRPKVLFQTASDFFDMYVLDDDEVSYRLVGNRYVAAAAGETRADGRRSSRRVSTIASRRSDCSRATTTRSAGAGGAARRAEGRNSRIRRGAGGGGEVLSRRSSWRRRRRSSPSPLSGSLNASGRIPISSYQRCAKRCWPPTREHWRTSGDSIQNITTPSSPRTNPTWPPPTRTSC